MMHLFIRQTDLINNTEQQHLNTAKRTELVDMRLNQFHRLGKVTAMLVGKDICQNALVNVAPIFQESIFTSMGNFS